jgi:hypothetical protein
VSLEHWAMSAEAMAGNVGAEDADVLVVNLMKS